MISPDASFTRSLSAEGVRRSLSDEGSRSFDTKKDRAFSRFSPKTPPEYESFTRSLRDEGERRDGSRCPPKDPHKLDFSSCPPKGPHKLVERRGGATMGASKRRGGRPKEGS